jgi:pseudaminic acid cytidylyltransferase
LIAIIPARKGSTRIPGKNKKLFHGKPIIQYSVETAQKSALFDEIIVSTDDDEIAAIAHRVGAFPFFRSKELSVNEVGTQEVAQDVLKNINIDLTDFVCIIYATAPLLTTDDLRRGLIMLQSSRSLNYAYSTDMDGNDIGNFYWCRAKALLEGEPLTENYATVPITPDRAIDINTAADWVIAEKMYMELNCGN